MQVKKSKPRPPVDSVERALTIVGDAWTFLILREAFFGVRRFHDFKANTGIAPNILSTRLRKLVDAGLFTRVRYSGHANRFEYRLTDMGRDLYPIIVMLMRWGDKWLNEGRPAPLTLVHAPCGGVLAPELRCNHCDRPIAAQDVEWYATRGDEG